MPTLAFVLRHRTAENHSSIFRQMTEHRAEHGSANIIKYNVCTIGGNRGQLIIEGLAGFVIDNLVIAKSILQPGTLFGAASNTDSGAAFSFGHLSSETANATGSSVDHKDITAFRCANIHQTKIRSHARGAETGEIFIGFHTGIQIEDRHKVGAIINAVLFPGGSAHYRAANRITAVTRLNNGAHNNALDRFTQGHRGEIIIARIFVHPLAKAGIHRKVGVLNQKLALF